MTIGDRLRDLRKAKNLSQGDIEKRTGLLRCYVSRVENGYIIPAMGTLEKWARALEIPLYQFFYDGDQPPEVPTVVRTPGQKSIDDWASLGKGLRMFGKITGALGRMTEGDRSLLLHLAWKMSRQSPSKLANRKNGG